jgi:uncharacterized protein involved in type VI secretion and phage assembly
MAVQQTAGRFRIELAGTRLAEDIANLLTTAVVDHDVNQPDMFVLAFHDPERAVLVKTGATIGTAITITAFSDLDSNGTELLRGEITALEFKHDASGSNTVVRGYDQSHRLCRGQSTEAYQNVTYADIAQKVAKRAGLDVGQIDSTTPVYPYVAQGNTTDCAFLKGLAGEVGYEVVVVNDKLHFRAPVASSKGPAAGNLRSTQLSEQLVFGSNVLRLRALVSAAEQVVETEVRGWDPSVKKALTSTAKASTTSADIGIAPSTVAQAFGTPKLVGSGVPYATTAEVDGAAKAMAEHTAGSFATLEGVARGNPKLRAGSAVTLSLVGDPFDGKYVLSATRHKYDPHDGYTTAFTVSGRNQHSLLALTTGSGRHRSVMAGVVPALVTDVNDPDGWGRIKVTFPWLSDKYTTDWVRMAQVGAGGQRGAVFLPEVNDEVLVSFDRGDWRRPYVVGSLYNGVDKPNLGQSLVDSSSGAVKRRGVLSKHGHSLIFFDDQSADGVALLSGDRSLRISMNQGSTTIKITSSGKIMIEGDGGVSMKSGADLSIEATGTLSLKGARVTIDGDSDVSVTGQPIKLN